MGDCSSGRLLAPVNHPEQAARISEGGAIPKALPRMF
jgi:hypothetical protein